MSGSAAAAAADTAAISVELSERTKMKEEVDLHEETDIKKRMDSLGIESKSLRIGDGKVVESC